MRKIAVANQKGGVGKTTTTICVAQELRNRGYKVCVLDTDAQCNTTHFYGAKTEGENTVMDILCGDVKAVECVQHTDNGDIIASDEELKRAETTVLPDERRFAHLRRSVASLEGLYDFLIVDTPPAIGVALKNVLGAVDEVIIPVDESGWSMEGIMDFSNAVDLARDANPKLKVSGILTCKTHPNTKRSVNMGKLAGQLAESLESKKFETAIRESTKFCEALTMYSVPLKEYAPYATTTKDYSLLVDEILEEEA
jgi:chromosome partitioning protein